MMWSVFRRFCHSALLLIMSGLCFPLLGTAALAHPIARQSVVTRPADPTGHATVIVLDMSGSMSTNDPKGYRCSAANAYIDLSLSNDYIGVVGLDNNNGARTGANNFQMAQSWSSPVSMATVQDKQALKSAIQTQSHNCHPDSTTPTYDALARAFQMLQSITRQHNVSGSVILLTDGTPSPDTDAQIASIKSDLLPQFRQHGWAIDTIGLGVDGPVGGATPGTFHGFLKDIANSTGGAAYDDTNGDVQGNNPNPLNIAPFFVQIFATYAHRTPNKDVPVTQLTGGSLQRNFSVVDGTNSLDVIAVKDQPGTTITLLNPAGQPILPDNVGVFLSQDSYHVIYSISNPQPGPWIVNATGSGQFLLYSLQETNFGLAINGVQLQGSTLIATAKDALPLGKALVITAHLTDNGQPFSSNDYAVAGSISYASPPSNNYAFTLSGNAGIYTGTVTVPDTEPAGSYTLHLITYRGTRQNVVASDTRTVRLEIFPIPLIINPKANQATTVVKWWLPLQILYSLPLADRLSGWPLGDKPALPLAVLQGQLQWQGKPYSGASVRATALLQNAPPGTHPLPVTITQDGQGNFMAQFEPLSSGSYTITFETSGTFEASQGSFGATTVPANIILTDQSLAQFAKALGVTGIYLLILALVICILRFWVTPAPSGSWIRNPGSENEIARSFGRARRNPLSAFLSRNYIHSRQAGMPRGLEIHFLHGNRVEVRPRGTGENDWQLNDGSKLRLGFQRVQELIYRPRSLEDADEDTASRYQIVAQSVRKNARSKDRDPYGNFGEERQQPSRRTRNKRPSTPDSSFAAPRSKHRNKSRDSRYDDRAPWEY